MIYLTTGLPGAGKTLLTLAQVRKRAQDEGRPVFYHGIELLKPELFPGWQVLDDPTTWPDLPDGSIVVHDEAQGTYRPRGNGAQVPRHVAELEVHRHKGLDLYFMTQHPMLVDSNLRRLVGEHVHVVRAFGTKAATRHWWQGVKEQCDKGRADSVATTVAYPSELLGAYKSATIHTHKARIPKRVFFLLLMPLLLAACAWGFYSWYAARSSGAAIHEQLDTVAAPGRIADIAPGRESARPKTVNDYVSERVPRMAGLAFTAPRYDEITEPVRVAVPAACVATGDRCRCYSQQATPLAVSGDLCRDIVANGYFLDFDPEGKGAERGREKAGATRSAGPAIVRPTSVAVSSIADLGDYRGTSARTRVASAGPSKAD